MSIQGKNELVENALRTVLGEGYSLRCKKVPTGTVFPETIRHFDKTGLTFLQPVSRTVRVSNNRYIADVVIVFVTCGACGLTHYSVDDVLIVHDYVLEQRALKQNGFQTV